MSIGIVRGLSRADRTGQFNGHVYDQNGAVVPDANVSLEDTQTHVTRTTKTNGEGLYQFPLIPPGTYKLTVTQTGFQTARSPESQAGCEPGRHAGLQTRSWSNITDGQCECNH